MGRPGDTTPECSQGGDVPPQNLAQPSRSSSRPQHPPTQLGLPSEMSKQQDFLVTAVTPTRPGKRGGGGGVRALPAGPYPALPTAQHSPTPRAPTTASRSPEQIRNRVTELLLRHPTVPPRGHHSVPPAHSTAPCIPFPPPLPKLTPSSRPPYLPLTPPHCWAARCPDPPMVTPTPGSQHGRHLLPCAVLSRADGKAKQTQTLSLHVAPDNGSPQTDLFRAN